MTSEVLRLHILLPILHIVIALSRKGFKKRFT